MKHQNGKELIITGSENTLDSVLFRLLSRWYSSQKTLCISIDPSLTMSWKNCM